MDHDGDSLDSPKELLHLDSLVELLRGDLLAKITEADTTGRFSLALDNIKEYRHLSLNKDIELLRHAVLRKRAARFISDEMLAPITTETINCEKRLLEIELRISKVLAVHKKWEYSLTNHINLVLEKDIKEKEALRAELVIRQLKESEEIKNARRAKAYAVSSFLSAAILVGCIFATESLAFSFIFSALSGILVYYIANEE